MNIGWRTKYILALSEDFLIHRWKLSGGVSQNNETPLFYCRVRKYKRRIHEEFSFGVK